MLLSNPWVKIGIVAAAFVTGIAAGHYVADNSWSAKWADAERDAATAQLNAVNTAVLQYKNRVQSLESISRETNKQLETVKNDAAIADIAANSLQQQIDNYVRKGGGNTASAVTITERAAAATRELLLAELLKRADRRSGELAKTADESRVRGLACEAEYEASFN